MKLVDAEMEGRFPSDLRRLLLSGGIDAEQVSVIDDDAVGPFCYRYDFPFLFSHPDIGAAS